MGQPVFWADGPGTALLQGLGGIQAVGYNMAGGAQIVVGTRAVGTRNAVETLAAAEGRALEGREVVLGACKVKVSYVLQYLNSSNKSYRLILSISITIIQTRD